MTKADLKNIEESDHDAVFMASEELAFEWIEFFLSDVNRIDRFFSEKQEALINEFIGMQERFRLKSSEYEDKKKKAKKVKNTAGQAMVLSIKSNEELLDEELQADYDFFDNSITDRKSDLENSETGVNLYGGRAQSAISPGRDSNVLR